MSFGEILDIILIILYVGGIAARAYLKARNNVSEAVSGLIAIAEESELTGPEKMAQVVAALNERVPVPFRGILTEERLEAIAQEVFNWMRLYAKNRAKAEKKKSEDPAGCDGDSCPAVYPES